jgi:hypothetical protein
VRLLRQQLQIGHAEVARAGPEEVGEGERGERRVASGAAAADRQPLAVGQPLLGQVAGGVGAVLDIDDAPVALQPLAVGAAVAGAAAVVDIDDGDPPARPELDAEVQLSGDGAGRATVGGDDQRR